MLISQRAFMGDWTVLRHRRQRLRDRQGHKNSGFRRTMPDKGFFPGTAWLPPVPASGGMAAFPVERLFSAKALGFFMAILSVVALMEASAALSHALTLEQALAEALATHPQVKAAEEDLRARKALERSSLSPYAPSLDFTGSIDRISRGSLEDRRDQSSFGAEYLLFDGGARFSDRSAARIQLMRAQQALRAPAWTSSGTCPCFFSGAGEKPDRCGADPSGGRCPKGLGNRRRALPFGCRHEVRCAPGLGAL